MVRSAPIFISSRSRPRRHHGRRKEQGEDEPNRGRASHHDEFPPADALREMQPCGDRHAGSRDDADRPAERGNRDRPDARLEAVERDAGIDQPEQQEHAFHGKAPPALEERQRIVSLRRRLDEQASIASPVGKKRHDRHQTPARDARRPGTAPTRTTCPDRAGTARSS